MYASGSEKLANGGNQMRKNWLLIGIGLFIAIFAFAAVACDDDDDEDNGATNGGEPTEISSAQIAGIVLSALEDSGVTGSATIVDVDGNTEVTVAVDGGLEEGSHLNHIHDGSCADPTGPVHVTLTALEADEGGSAATTTTTEFEEDNPDFAHWLEADHYVAVHDLGGAIVACGDVTAA